MSDLALVKTDELLIEVFNRFEHCVFAGLLTGRGDGTQQEVRRKWKGNHATCCGLGFSLSHAIMKDHYEQSEEGRLEE